MVWKNIQTEDHIGIYNCPKCKINKFSNLQRDVRENDIKQHFNNLTEWRVFIQYYSLIFILSFNTFSFL